MQCGGGQGWVFEKNKSASLSYPEENCTFSCQKVEDCANFKHDKSRLHALLLI